ncbi:hypothetical protein FHU33_2104 [Blastococcus colisei]|uniref:Uncharacterized protein n=1 Tax=Blastococcus colisei TaxID=1564162 RepID=A0A543PF61_9ACTN|nr:hypothetical protein FHU33_2104 [Blastococcus colisei]
MAQRPLERLDLLFTSTPEGARDRTSVENTARLQRDRDPRDSRGISHPEVTLLPNSP